MMKLLPIVMLLTACTYNITVIQTQGRADDLVDETSTSADQTQVSPTLNLPKEL